MNKNSSTRRDKIRFLKKIKAGHEITISDYRKFETIDFTKAVVYIKKFDGDAMVWFNVKTKEIETDEQHQKRWKGKPTIIFK